MGIANWLGFGKEISEPVDAVGNALDKLFTSDEERLTKQEILDKTNQNPTLWQKSLDMLNASSKVWFVAAARPFCVWISGINFFQMGIAITWFEKAPPTEYITASTTAFFGALGIYGVLRTIEKSKGKQDN
jgi:hypothetical protein